MADVNGAKKIRFVLMKEHPLMGYALSFMMGAYLAISIAIPVLYVIILAAASFFTIVYLVLNKKKSKYVFLLLFLALGYILCFKSIPEWYNTDYIPPDECRITGRVESVKVTGYSYEYIISDVITDNNHIESKIKISNITDRDYIKEGDIIALKAVLEKPAAAQQSGMYSEKRYLMTKGIQYVCTVFDSYIAVTEKAETSSISSILQGKIYTKLNKDFIQPVSGILYSLTTGDKSYMDKDIYAACSELGIAHIFAISGLHIGALLLLWELYCQRTKKRFLVKVAGSTVLVVLLYFVVGSRASLLRAIFMWLLIVMYQYTGLKGNLTDFLSIAVIGLLVMEPFYIVDIGFLLSVACVAAIGLVYVPAVKRAKTAKMKKFISFYPVSMFIVSMSVLVFSWVITARVFGQVALFSPIWNIVFVPMTVLLISILLAYYAFSFIPILGTVIIWTVDGVVNLMAYLIKAFSAINIDISFRSISVYAALLIIAVSLLMTDAAIKGYKRIRIASGAAAIALVLAAGALWPQQEKIEIYAGYDAAFVYIYEDGETILIINEDDGGIERVLKDIGENEVDMLIYSGNKADDLDELIEGLEGIEFGEIIASKDLLENYSGENNYIPAESGEMIKIGDTSLYISPFQANENAIVHYYVYINYHGTEFVYIDPLRLREGAIPKSECAIMISSRWTKQRIENAAYADCKYVIMNSRDYLMAYMPEKSDGSYMLTFNINNSGAFTYYPEGEK
ncbi:MAG: ComEC/Rec2 family competence protein [Clostridia bacterium]|nr:ComEC/Rec2 family competence protein [Clostridia bacterium]